jgi:pseudaminic acid cytidylyltransferase
MKALCIIPARGGSKRIPRKNVRPFLGRPIIAYPIAAALESGCFEEVMVSTDDEEIAAIARDLGASVPCLRSARNSDDYAGSDDVFREVLHFYRQQGRDYAVACGLYPTAALTTAEHLRRGREALLADQQVFAVAPILRFSFPVQRALAFRRGRIPLLQPEHYHTRSQDLEPAYHDAGQWYWFRVDAFLRTGELLGPNCGGVVLSAVEAQDIDTEDDWTMAELKYQARRQPQPLA